VLSGALSDRQKHMYNGRLDPCGAVHITIGDGGNQEGLAHRQVIFARHITKIGYLLNWLLSEICTYNY